MAVNTLFKTYTSTLGQKLIEDLVIQSIKIKGMDMKYLPKTFTDFDYLYGEDPSAAFNTSIELEMYMQSVDGFEGDDRFSKWSYTIKKSCIIALSKKRFEQEVTALHPTILRPLEGDVIYMPITNAILEIKFVDCDDPFYQNGAQYVYKLRCELYEFSRETFETDDTEVDSLVAEILGNINPETAHEEHFGDNESIETDANSLITFDPDNPFGGK